MARKRTPSKNIGSRNPDPAAADTDKIIAKMEKEIRAEYTQAKREIAEKVEDYWKRYDLKKTKWESWVQDGTKTEQQYREWLTGQLAIGERWETLRDQLAKDLENSSKIAQSVVLGHMPEVYALNHNFGTYQIEHGCSIDTSYTLYSRFTVEKLFRDNPKLLPKPGKKVSEDIKKGKAVEWNKKHIQSVMMQAVLQGNSIPDIAQRLANTVCDQDMKAATRNARTMATAAQNLGRLDSYERAKDLGIPVKKQWLATLDTRTRHEHRVLDGQVQETDKPFEVEYKGKKRKLMLPGDPNALPALVYNCRCTTLAVVMDKAFDVSDTSLRHDKHLGDMTYDEWKASKKETPNPIMMPKMTAEKNRADYIHEYRGEDKSYVAPGWDKTLTIDAVRKKK